MNGKLIVLAGALLALVAGVEAKSSRSSKSKLPIKHPISVDADEALITPQVVSDFFTTEMNIRDRMLAERYFAKPLSDQKASVSEIVGYLAVDPLHGMSPRFLLDAKGEVAQRQYKEWESYMIRGHVRGQLLLLLRKAQVIMFDRSAKMVGQIEFYNQVGTEALAGLKVFDTYMYKLANGAPAFKKKPEAEGASWSDLLKFCELDVNTFLHYYQFNPTTQQIVMEATFLNQLNAAKEHGDDLPPPTVAEWASTADKFLNGDLANYRKTITAAYALVGKSDRITPIYERDQKVADAIEKVLKGMIGMKTTFTSDVGLGQLRTGKGLYKYTTGRYALPALPTDKVVDHVFLINLMLRRFQSEMKGHQINRTGVTDEQKKKAAAWRRKHQKAPKK